MHHCLRDPAAHFYVRTRKNKTGMAGEVKMRFLGEGSKIAKEGSKNI